MLGQAACAVHRAKVRRLSEPEQMENKGIRCGQMEHKGIRCGQRQETASRTAPRVPEQLVLGGLQRERQAQPLGCTTGAVQVQQPRHQPGVVVREAADVGGARAEAAPQLRSPVCVPRQQAVAREGRRALRGCARRQVPYSSADSAPRTSMQAGAVPGRA